VNGIFVTFTRNSKGRLITINAQQGPKPGCADYSGDMPKQHFSLWVVSEKIRSDYSADMRKFNWRKRMSIMSVFWGRATMRATAGDAEQSLATVPANRSTRATVAGLGEPEIAATLPGSVLGTPAYMSQGLRGRCAADHQRLLDCVAVGNRVLRAPTSASPRLPSSS
jgi:hypothetical protein